LFKTKIIPNYGVCRIPNEKGRRVGNTSTKGKHLKEGENYLPEAQFKKNYRFELEILKIIEKSGFQAN
jgi:hypothetical protein